MFQNFFDEVRELLEMVQIGGDLSDMNKQADILLDLLEDEAIMNQNAIDYLNEHYDIRNGYCMCGSDKELTARIAGIELAHDLITTTKGCYEEEEVITPCIEAAEEYYQANAQYEEFKDFAMNYSEQAETLTRILHNIKEEAV